MKKRKVQFLAALCCVMMVVAVGCGSKEKSNNTNDNSKNQSTQTEQVEEKTNGKEEKEESSKKDKEQKKDEKEIKKNETKNEEEKHTLEGTLAEKKDFMFVVEDAEKKASVFAFSEKPEGYDELKVDDTVVVEYTGEVSEVDAFTGEVISVTKSVVKGK